MENIEQVIKDGIASVESKLKSEFDAQKAELQAKIDQLVEDGQKSGQSLGEISEKVNNLIAKSGKLRTEEARTDHKDLGSVFGKMISDNIGQFANVFATKGLNLEYKAPQDMTTATNHTGNVAITQFQRPPVLFPQFRHMRSILNVVPSATLQVDYPREKTPDGEGSFGPQSSQGAEKNQVDYDTEMISLTLDYEAAFATISRQNLTNVPWVQGYLTRKLTEGFYRREDVKTLNFMDSLATASATSATVVAEAIIDMIAEVDGDGYGSNGILTTPALWASILKTKPSDYSIPGGVSFTTDGMVSIGGLPLFKHQNVTANKIYVGDWSSLYIVQGGSFSIRSSEFHADNFTKNKVTFLAEAPIGIAFEAPRAIRKKTM
jgi:HK97 family phage major capsid protein